MKGKLFTRYLDAASGTGLGLSIVHAIIVDRYQGKIEFKNRVDRDYMKGTTLKFHLGNGASKFFRFFCLIPSLLVCTPETSYPSLSHRD